MCRVDHSSSSSLDSRGVLWALGSDGQRRPPQLPQRPPTIDCARTVAISALVSRRPPALHGRHRLPHQRLLPLTLSATQYTICLPPSLFAHVRLLASPFLPLPFASLSSSPPLCPTRHGWATAVVMLGRRRTAGRGKTLVESASEWKATPHCPSTTRPPPHPQPPPLLPPPSPPRLPPLLPPAAIASFVDSLQDDEPTVSAQRPAPLFFSILS